MPLKEFPVWSDGVVFPAVDPQRAVPPRVDLAIVGAWYKGLDWVA